MKMNLRVKTPYFRDVFNEIVRELSRVLKVKCDNPKIEQIKIVGTPEEIIRQFLNIFEEFLKRDKFIIHAKTTKIKRIWMEKLNNKQEYSFTLQLLVCEHKGRVKLSLNESKKENKDVIVDFTLEL